MHAQMTAAALAVAALLMAPATLSSAEYHRPQIMPGAVDCTMRKIKNPFLKVKLRHLEAALQHEVERQQILYDARQNPTTPARRRGG